jgi:phospholipase C
VLVALAALTVAVSGCSDSRATMPPAPGAASPGAGKVTGPSPAVTSSAVTAGADAICGRAEAPPPVYEHVVVIMEENRTWPEVGGVGFGRLPYLASVAAQCTVYRDWLETNPSQNSLTQYIGLTSGVDNPATVDDCRPSATCRSTDDNIFRQVRVAGGTARTFVEGPTDPCSAKGNAAKHVPALYYAGGDDPAHCTEEVRPLSDFDPNHLPTFAFIVPDQCHDGHDCSNTKVDAWLADHLQPILAGDEYRAGRTAVFVLYDEDRPVPNLVIAPTARAGQIDDPGAGHSAALRTFEDLLGLPVLAPAADSPSLRASADL